MSNWYREVINDNSRSQLLHKRLCYYVTGLFIEVIRVVSNREC